MFSSRYSKAEKALSTSWSRHQTRTQETKRFSCKSPLKTAQYFGCTGFLLSAAFSSVAVIFKGKQKGVLRHKVRKATLLYS